MTTRRRDDRTTDSDGTRGRAGARPSRRRGGVFAGVVAAVLVWAAGAGTAVAQGDCGPFGGTPPKIDFSQAACKSADECFFRQRHKLMGGNLEKGVAFYECVDGKEKGKVYTGWIQTGTEDLTQLDICEEIVVEKQQLKERYKLAGFAHSHPNRELVVDAKVGIKMEKDSFGNIREYNEIGFPSLSGGPIPYGPSTPGVAKANGQEENDLDSIAQFPGIPAYVLDMRSGSTVKLVYDGKTDSFRQYEARQGETRFSRCPNDICRDPGRAASIRETTIRRMEEKVRAELGDEAWKERYAEQLWTTKHEAAAQDNGTSNPNLEWKSRKAARTKAGADCSASVGGAECGVGAEEAPLEVQCWSCALGDIGVECSTPGCPNYKGGKTEATAGKWTNGTANGNEGMTR